MFSLSYKNFFDGLKNLSRMSPKFLQKSSVSPNSLKNPVTSLKIRKFPNYPVKLS